MGCMFKMIWLPALLICAACGDSDTSDSVFTPTGAGGAAAGAAGAGGQGVGGSGTGQSGQSGEGGSAGVAGAGGSDAGAGGSDAGAGGTGAGAGGSAGVSGAVVKIHLVSSTAPFSHSDVLSGQTPITHLSGLRSYRIFRDDSDVEGVSVFDLGQGFIEVSYDDGADTLVATVPLKNIPEGTYTRGQVVHTHVRYRIAATAHNAGFAVPGEFDNLQVMSDGTTINGATYQSGHYEYVFNAAGSSFPLKGEGAPIPQQASTGGFAVKLVDGQWIYEFPVNVVIDHSLTSDVDAAIKVNMFESFRWQDQDAPGYAPQIFDVTPLSFEPVVKFGANSFVVTFN
jgi:hypothetical protein